MLVVRAGREDIPTLNDALDRFVAKALAANAPITVTNHPTGGHGFDSFDIKGDVEHSKQIVRSGISCAADIQAMPASPRLQILASAIEGLPATNQANRRRLL
jgi:hypothetical protein